ncbi:TetR/AcrR family transcriptional regulator [Nocardiopsis exhalans]|uniref:TetR/AcrR family transcriptional regulator n=1 Tax=Nocardiopsis exhalans TaxID=163604 RepID=A0ABY5D215_9ACTN|nr:TetR/AcrR family transcriptional regulator [Nocardiopsis exhalans]USY18406.1 TetR/AcrR family transcriptional regulator [Nocardiopsis exhalans]
MGQRTGAQATEDAPTTRRRGEELRQAIFTAVFDELRTTGYARLTMESVAATASTGKSALYRRWPDKEAMVRDALRSTLPDPHAVPLTGDTRTDLTALLSFLQTVFNRSSGTVFQVVASEVGAETGFMRSLVNDHAVAPCKERIQEVLRDSLTPSDDMNADLALLAEVGPAMLTHHCLTGEPSIPDDYVTEIVDVVLMRLTKA